MSKQFVVTGAAIAVCAAVLLAGTTAARQKPAAAAAPPVFVSKPFGETVGGVEINASGIVFLDDSRFLVCDNRSSGAMFELRLDADGVKSGSLVRREFSSPTGSHVGDLEALALVQTQSGRCLVATSSFNLVGGKKKEKGTPQTASGLLRFTLAADTKLIVEDIPEFRDWLVAAYPQLRDAAQLRPDKGGLNIEGLGWDPRRSAFLFGVRTPLFDGRPAVLPVRVKDPLGPWTKAAFEAMPAIRLDAPDLRGVHGVRGIDDDLNHAGFLVILGNAVSGTDAPFQVYRWDGEDSGRLARFPNLQFAPDMKVEGLTAGTIGGREALVIVDDAGGYGVLWSDDPRLQSTETGK